MKLLVSLLLFTYMNSTYAQFNPQQRDRAVIDSIYRSLREIAESDLTCETSDDCVVYATGTRACGGPSGSVITSSNNKNLPYVEYLAKLTAEKEHEFNIQYGVISICSVLRLPVPTCVSNKCIAVK